MFRKLTLFAITGLLVGGMAATGMAITAEPQRYWTRDGYVTSDFTKKTSRGYAPVETAKVQQEPAYTPSVEATPEPQYVESSPAGIRYYRYDSRLPDAGKIYPGGRVINP